MGKKSTILWWFFALCSCKTEKGVWVLGEIDQESCCITAYSPHPLPKDFSIERQDTKASVIYTNHPSPPHFKTKSQICILHQRKTLSFVWVGKDFDPRVHWMRFRNLFAVRDAGNFKKTPTDCLALRSPCWSGAALPGLPESHARAGRGPGGAAVAQPSRAGRARSGSRPSNASGAPSAPRPMGVTSLRCLIRRSACAARAAGAPVTARPQRRRCSAPRPADARTVWKTRRSRLPAEGMGGRPGTLAPSLDYPSLWGSWSISL